MAQARTPRSQRAQIALILALALLLAGCGGAAATSGPSLIPTPTATATFALGGKFATATAQAWTPTLPPDAAQYAPVAGRQANWRSANLPDGFGLAYHYSWMGVSANSGNVAYSCAQGGSPPGASEPAVETVKTSDGGGSWARVADLSQNWDGCGYVIVDANNPNIVALSGMTDAAPAFSRDGGATWQVSGSVAAGALTALASVGSRTYGLFAQKDESGKLEISADGLATWRDITGPMAGKRLLALWANPTTGALLVAATVGFSGPTTLWRSADGGGSWASANAPTATVGAVVALAAGAPDAWTICLNEGDNYSGVAACSVDSGVHWAPLPQLDDAGLRGYGVVGVASDGAVLVVGDADTFQRLYRLPRGATRWQSLGDIPQTTGTLLYTPTAGGGGMLWSLPSVKGGGSGDSNPSDIYVATYPY